MRRVFEIFSSWWLSALLAGGFASVFMVMEDFRAFMEYLLGNTLGMLLCLVLILNLCLISVRIGVRNLRKTLPERESPEGMTSYCNICPPPSQDAILRFAERLGFRPLLPTGDTGVLARGRFSFLPGMFLRIGVVLALAGLMASFHYREAGERILHEGDTFSFREMKGVVGRIRPDLPLEFLQIGGKGAFNVERVALELRLDGRVVEADSGLPAYVGGGYFRVSDFGFSHELIIRKEGSLKERMVDASVLPPGKTAVIPFTEEDMVITLKMEPLKKIKKGLLTGNLYRFDDIRYRMVLQSGRKKDIKQVHIVTPGTPVNVSPSSLSAQRGDMEIILGPPAYFVRVSMVYDPGIPLIVSGLLMFLTGLASMPARFFWYLRRIAWVKTERGLMVGYESEFYRKWAIQKFHNIRIDLFSAPEPGDGKAD